MTVTPNDTRPCRSTKRDETRLFVFLIVFLFPS